MAETVLPLRGGVVLDGVQFPTDPGLYEPLAQPKRYSVHRTDGGGLTFQDGGLTVVDNRVRLGSGNNLGGDPQLIDTTAVRELHRRYRQFGSTFSLTDWLGNEFTVFIAEFRPRIHRRDLWTYDMLLLVTDAARTLPVGPFLLTVENGIGGGEYFPGAIVSITANAPPLGQQFLAWSGAVVASPTSPSTTLRMPSSKTFVEALYNATGKFTLTVVNGSGDGDYRAGDLVTIIADDPPTDQRFTGWTGAAAMQNPNARTTTLVMPVANTTITATYGGAEPGTFILTVIGGRGGGSYFPGALVPISQDTPPDGFAFLNWATSPPGILVAQDIIRMPAVNATVTAVFLPLGDLISTFSIVPPVGYSISNPWNQALQGPVPFSIGALSGWGIPAPFFDGQVEVYVEAGGVTLLALFNAAMQQLVGLRTDPFVTGNWTGFAQFNTDGVPQVFALKCRQIGGNDIGGNSTGLFYVLA